MTHGRCHADPAAAAARPLAQLIRGVTGEHAEAWIREQLADDDRVDVIARRVLGVLGLSDEPAQPGETAWAVRRVLEAAARDRPLLAVVEDAHWADPVLLDVVDYTLAFSGGAAILLLCLARPELLEARPGWAVPHADSALLQLEPLDGADARALVDALADGLDAAAAERIVATAEGNPLFLEQLLAVRAEGERTLPPSIEGVLAARIDRLDPHEREVLRHASLEGRRFHVRATAALLPPDERDALDRALIGLVQRQLIRPDRPDFAGEDAFRFSHALIRDAAYAGMPKRLRGELHERLADWLRARPHVADETVGFQLEQAWRLRRELGPPDQHDRALAGEAADRLAAAGHAELRRGDAAAAGELLERAVVLVEEDDPARAGLLVQLGATLVEAGRLADADRRLDAAIALAAADGRPAPRRPRPRRARARAPACEPGLPPRRPRHRRCGPRRARAPWRRVRLLPGMAAAGVDRVDGEPRRGRGRGVAACRVVRAARRRRATSTSRSSAGARRPRSTGPRRCPRRSGAARASATRPRAAPWPSRSRCGRSRSCTR